jgi:asparagine synthase (glutamine-hydrolysing)
MCGICGFAPFDAQRKPDERLIWRMCAPLISRGPDDAGVFTGGGVGLGHRRLSVIDLQTGSQPMSDASGRYTIVFNGEIYNYEALRRDLAKRHSFLTTSDTEVLLYGLIDGGVEFLGKTNGMFAFGLWDAKERSLLIGRDRFGVKPLYFATAAGQGLLFASEASAIEASNLMSNAIDRQTLALFLAWSYIPNDRSIFIGVEKLPAGSWLKWSGGRIERGVWWDLSAKWQSAQANAIDRSAQEWREEFGRLLSDAVKIRLKSDVPLGAFLSGGLDSAAIAALMKRHTAQVNTFTIAFADKSHNEAPLARQSAEAIGTTHREQLVNVSGADRLLSIAATLDEPFADTSIVPTHALCQTAKQFVTVALSGDGADELLGGYVTHQADAIYGRVSLLPSAMLKASRWAVNLLPDNHRKLNAAFKLKQFFAAYPRPAAQAHACWRLLFYPDALGSLLLDFDRSLNIFASFEAAYDEAQLLPSLDRFLFVDYKTWLIGDVLTKSDRAGMRHGLEVRSPYMDYRLFELCAAMPASLKRHGRASKVVLREFVREILPPFVTSRPKRGFNAPVAQWLCNEWRDISETAFQSGAVESAGLSSEFVGKLWREHKSGAKNHGFRLFNILSYLLWRSARKESQ